MKHFLLLFGLFFSWSVFSQEEMSATKPAAENEAIQETSEVNPPERQEEGNSPVANPFDIGPYKNGEYQISKPEEETEEI